jgi:GAF domain-containing protein
MDLLGRLGVTLRPDDEFDRKARELAEALGVSTSIAMVNFLGPAGQFFAGLHTPPGVEMGRVMKKEDGWCVFTISREVPLPLGDVNDWNRVATNRVTAEFGIQSYLGAPILGRAHSGVQDGNLGTVCVIDRATHDWTDSDVHTIKAFAQEVSDLIYRRAGLH